MDTVNEFYVLLLKLTKRSHKLMVAKNLLASYGCGRIASNPEGCTIGNAAYYVVYVLWSSSSCYL